MFVMEEGTCWKYVSKKVTKNCWWNMFHPLPQGIKALLGGWTSPKCPDDSGLGIKTLGFGFWGNFSTLVDHHHSLHHHLGECVWTFSRHQASKSKNIVLRPELCVFWGMNELPKDFFPTHVDPEESFGTPGHPVSMASPTRPPPEIRFPMQCCGSIKRRACSWAQPASFEMLRTFHVKLSSNDWAVINGPLVVCCT